MFVLTLVVREHAETAVRPVGTGRHPFAASGNAQTQRTYLISSYPPTQPSSKAPSNVLLPRRITFHLNHRPRSADFSHNHSYIRATPGFSLPHSSDLMTRVTAERHCAPRAATGPGAGRLTLHQSRAERPCVPRAATGPGAGRLTPSSTSAEGHSSGDIPQVTPLRRPPQAPSTGTDRAA